MLTRWSDFDRILGWPDYRSTVNAMEQFRRQLGRLFEDWDSPTAYGANAFPRCNLYDTGTELIVTAEVPGMTSKEVEVTVQQNVLSLSGKREDSVPEGYTVHRQERMPIHFQRTFSLPTRVDVEKTSAQVKDGILTVHLAKAADAQPRQITVQTK